MSVLNVKEELFSSQVIPNTSLFRNRGRRSDQRPLFYAGKKSATKHQSWQWFIDRAAFQTVDARVSTPK